MKKKLFSLLALAFCTASSWALDPVNGVYQIGTAQDLVDFAALVNGGTTGANAVLTTNIDMTDTEWNNPIGVSGYKGHFDGQGYTINGLEYTTKQDYHGLFGKLNAGALVENFTIYGDIDNVSYDAIAVVGYTNGTTINIRNIISYLNLTNSGNDKKIGGILGNGNQGTTNVDRCAFFGTIETTDKANVGGIAAYIQNNASTYVNFSNCLFDGTLESTNNSSYVGGIVGYIGANNSRYTIKNCLGLGTISARYAGSIIGYARNKGGGSNNNYIRTGGKTYGRVGDNCATTDYPATEVTAEQLASGEVCFALNESVSGGENWFQTLDDDDYPTPNGSDKVYANGSYLCDGVTPKEGSTVTYGNTDDAIVDPHNFVDGFCTVCDALDESYSMTPNSDNYFEIGTPNQLKWFAAYVNAGNPASNAVLTADIDMAGKAWPKPIGDWSNSLSTAYAGNFNGQGHAITNLEYTTAQSYHGLFGVTTSGALIENFSIAGTVTNNDWGQFGGVVGYTRDATTTIRNVKSSVNFVNTKAGQRIGGIVGQVHNGTTKIENCIYSGTLNAGKLTGNYGGIVGYVNNDSRAHLTITNCLFDEVGVVSNNGANGECGGIIGYAGANLTDVTIENCLSLGTVDSNVSGQFFGAVKSTKCSIVNSYYQGSAVNGAPSDGVTPTTCEATEATDEQLASGEVAYKLGSAWYQTLGTDTYPTLSSASEKVLYVGAAGYSTFYDPDNDWELVGGAQAYIGILSSSSSIHLDEISDIPAGTAVVISGTYYNKVSTSATATTTGNKLLGSDGTVSGGEGIYALAIKNDVVGFYPVASSITIPEGRAYLDTNTNPVKGFFSFEEDDATAIKAIDNEQSTDNVIYNVAGQRLQKMQNGRSTAVKGIYIVNGKKVLF